MATLISVGGVDFTPFIKEYRVDISDLDVDSKRNTAGKLIRKRIAVKRKVVVSFQPILQQDIQKVLNAVANDFVSVYFLDPQDGYVTKTMYVSDRTSPVALIQEENVWWNGLAFDLVEQ
jgi:hypothetical protein